MKEVVLLGAYTNTIEKEATLIKNILDWKKHNIPIILSTHYPVSEKIQNLVDYYIFDKEQYLDPRLINLHTYSCNDFKIAAKYDRPYHAAAIVVALQNAIKLIRDKFDFIYFQEYDVESNKSDILKFVRQFHSSIFNLFVFNWDNNPNSYATNVYFFKQECFDKIWGNIRSANDYLIKSTNHPSNLMEPLFKNLTEVLNDSVYVFDKDQTKKLIINFNSHIADIVEPRIYLSRTSNGHAILFLVNPLQDMLTFKMQIRNLASGEQQEIIQNVSGRIGMYWRLFSNGIHLQVSCNNTKKEYYLVECNNFNECWFEFTNGTQIFMKQ